MKYIIFYNEQFLNILNVYKDETNELARKKIIKRFNEFIIQNKFKYYCYTIEDIIDWVIEQKNEINFDVYNIQLPDYIDICEDIILNDANKNKILLSWENTELSPKSGEINTIYWEVKNISLEDLMAE